MTTTYSRPKDLLAAVLAAVQAEFTLAEVPLPARQFATTGIVIFDSEQLSVSLVRMYGIEPDQGSLDAVYPHRNLSWRGAEFEVLLLRCAPTADVMQNGEVRAPSAADYQAYGDRVLEDAAIIVRGLVRAAEAETLGIGPVVHIVGWESVGEADLGGGALRVRVSLV